MFQRPAAFVLAFALAASASAAQAGDLLDPSVDNPIGRPTGDPTQGGGDHSYPTSLRYPDLTLDVLNLPGMAVGGAFAPWNGQIALSSANAAQRVGGYCAFPYLYLVKNVGGATSSATSNAIYRYAGGFTVVAVSALPALSPGVGAVDSGTLWLPAGASTLLVLADASLEITESNGENNLRAIQVTVSGACG